MSAPRTNVERQTRRHRPAMIVLTLAIAAAFVFFLIHLGSALFEAEEPATPGDPEAAGAVEPDPAPAAPDAEALDAVEPTPPAPPAGD